MERDQYKTKVIFRKWVDPRYDGAVIAWFPECKEESGFIACYEHIGQHGSGDYWGCLEKTRPATPTEYAPLKKELESIGYNLEVRKRFNR